MKSKFNIVMGVLILMLLSGTVGCQQTTESNKESTQYTEFKEKIQNHNNISYLEVAHDGDAISYGILDRDGNSEISNVYHLNQGETFSRFINIANFIDEDMKYKLLVFCNYQQIAFKVEGQQVECYDVFIEKGKDLQIPVEIKSLEKGYNDLVFVIVMNAKDQMNADERENTLDQNICDLRCAVYVENTDVPSYKVQEYPTEAIVKPLSNALPISVHERAEQPNKLFTMSSASKGERTEYYVTVANDEDEDCEYAILLLEDWQQRDICDKQYLILKIPSNTQVTLPVSTSFKTSGIYDITAIYIANPYKEEAEDEYTVDASIRLGIDVK